MPLLDLPNETLDQIIFNVDSPKDILSIALTARILHSIAIPSHLHYRSITTRLLNQPLWDWLTRLDDLSAAHVRSLTIMSDYPGDLDYKHPEYDVEERVMMKELDGSKGTPPYQMKNEDLVKQEKGLIGALKRMERLKRFGWYRAYRPRVQAGKGGEDGETGAEVEVEDVWTVLKALGTVKEIDVLDVLDPWVTPSVKQVPSVVFSPNFLALDNLTSFKLCTAFADGPEETDITPIERMLINSPNLQELVLYLDLSEEILCGCGDLTNLLTRASGPTPSILDPYTSKNAQSGLPILWPNLRLLRLRGLYCRVAPLVAFFETHPHIEELRLSRMTPGRMWDTFDDLLQPGTFPRLRKLECSTSQAACFLKEGVAPVLEDIGGIELMDLIRIDSLFSWDDEWEDERASYDGDVQEDSDRDSRSDTPSPWKSLFLQRLTQSSTIKKLNISCISNLRELDEVARAAPGVTELVIGYWASGPIEYDGDSGKPPLDDDGWYTPFAHFRSLVFLTHPALRWFVGWHKDLVGKTNDIIQRLAKECPTLRAIYVIYPDTHIVIWRPGVTRPGKGKGGVRWMVREVKDSKRRKEELLFPYPLPGEVVYP